MNMYHMLMGVQYMQDVFQYVTSDIKCSIRNMILYIYIYIDCIGCLLIADCLHILSISDQPGHFWKTQQCRSKNEKRPRQACSAVNSSWGYHNIHKCHLYYLIFIIIPYWYHQYHLYRLPIDCLCPCHGPGPGRGPCPAPCAGAAVPGGTAEGPGRSSESQAHDEGHWPGPGPRHGHRHSKGNQQATNIIDINDTHKGYIWSYR